MNAMAKLCRPILEYKDKIVNSGIDVENGEYKIPKATVKRFIFFMRRVSDTRVAGMIDYPLSEVLVIAFLAVLAGASGWGGIETFGKAKEKWLKKFLVLECGIPSHDTFRRVFALIDPQQFGAATVAFLMERIHKIKKSLKINSEGYKHIGVDGKEAKGTGRKYDSDEKIPNLQTLHIYDSSNSICLVSASIDKKTNEIPVAQQYLGVMQLKDCIVTFDSMNTQKKTIAIIVEKGGEYIGALKGNHENFHQDIIDYFTEDVLKSIAKKKENFYSVTEKAHNKIETRKYYLTTDINWFAEKKLWAKLKSFICYELNTEDLVTGKKTFERRYYIASVKDIELCADSIRQHWSVESMHWHLDKTFFEDDNTTIDKNAFNNLSQLYKLVLTLYKLIQPFYKKNTSIRKIKLWFGWDFEIQFAKLLNMFDEKFLETFMLDAKK